jgi:hypothetical protein
MATVTIAPVIPTMIIPVLVTVIIPTITMPFPINRNELAVVPVVLHKVDPLVAGVIFVAIPGPILAMARGYAQIDRFALYHYPLDDSRVTIDHSRRRIRIIANVESAIEAGLADANRNSNVGSECRSGNGGSSYCRCNQKTFHVESPFVRHS